MRKRIIDQDQKNSFSDGEERLDLERLAQVEITSEDAAHPIEGALRFSSQTGWRAAEAGRQTIRIIFDEPQRINSIHLRFEEEQQARTQEFVLQCSPGKGEPFKEIVRQQYNFSPGSSTEEQENYTLHIDDVKVVELSIVPDVGGGNSRASLSSLWIR